MITITRAVEHHPGDACRFRLRRQELAHSLGTTHLAGAVGREPLAQVAHAEQGGAELVVDELRVDVLERAEHHEPRPLGGAGDPLPDPQVAAVAQLGTALRGMNRAHYLAPVFPAL